MKKLGYSLGTVLLVLFLSFPASAQVQSAGSKLLSAALNVTSAADTDDGACTASNCTLREAINLANADHINDTIYFNFYGTIVLGSPLPTITDTLGYLNITGSSGGIRISGANSYQIFNVQANASLMLQLLTISYAHSSAAGAALRNFGNVTIHRCIFSNNISTLDGGAIYNSTGAYLDITDTAFSYNQADEGGAIYSYGNAAILQVLRGTFDHNSATTDGGAVFQGSGTTTITNSSFTANSAPHGAAVVNATGYPLTLRSSTIFANIVSNINGGAVENYPGVGTLTVMNTIVANTSGGGKNCNGLITNGGNNLDSAATCGWSTNLASLSNTNPQLDPLGNYGGYVQTIGLKANSPAIDAASYSGGICEPTDQRGARRPADGNRDGIARCDIGAFEVQQYVYLPVIMR